MGRKAVRWDNLHWEAFVDMKSRSLVENGTYDGKDFQMLLGMHKCSIGLDFSICYMGAGFL